MSCRERLPSEDGRRLLRARRSRALAVQLGTPSSGRGRAALSPALAAAKRRRTAALKRAGLDPHRADVRPCPAPARPAATPLPALPSALELCALLDGAARARGVRGVHRGRFASCAALLCALHAVARARERGRPVSGTVRTSWGWLARLVGPEVGWSPEPDHEANANLRRSSLRRWLRELEAAGLVRVAIVVDELGQERGQDIELLPAPTLDDVERACARLQLTTWEHRHGPTTRSSAILARIDKRRAATAVRYAPRRARAQASDVSGLPPKGAYGGRGPSNLGQYSGVGSCGARGRHESGDSTSEGDTRCQPRDSSAAPTTSSADGSPCGTEDRRSVSSWRDDLAAPIATLEARQAAADAAWTPRIDAATRICLVHRPTPDAPLPSLAALRLALAGRLQGTLALAGGAPVAGLGDKLCRQFHAAAGVWVRSRPASALSPAAELLRRADDAAGCIDLGELVRAFRRDAKRAARAARADNTRRLNAAHRRAKRDQAAILAAWPNYIRRDERDRLVMDAGERYIQLTRLPDWAQFERASLRRWLRDVTAWQWGTPADAVEFTDPDGRYAYVPLDAARLAQDGDRTRGPWISTVPARKIAAERAAAEIQGASTLAPTRNASAARTERPASAPRSSLPAVSLRDVEATEPISMMK